MSQGYNLLSLRMVISSLTFSLYTLSLSSRLPFLSFILLSVFAAPDITASLFAQWWFSLYHAAPGSPQSPASWLWASH